LGPRDEVGPTTAAILRPHCILNTTAVVKLQVLLETDNAGLSQKAAHPVRSKDVNFGDNG